MHMSYHAHEQIAKRGITETEVEDAIHYGARWPHPVNETYSFARKGDLMVVLDGKSWVITSYRVNN